jgi:hypothetical protein
MDHYVLSLLHEPGWTPQRKVDVDQLVSRLRDCGFLVSKRAIEFLECFYGISFTYQFAKGQWTDSVWFDLNPDVDFNPDTAEFYAIYAGESLCPVGFSDRTDASLFIGASGALYMSQQGYFTRLGMDALTGIQAMVSEREFTWLFQPTFS